MNRHPEVSPGELTSWKEIAGFLKVTVRTAQQWERHRGLPVKRMPGKRGRVFADPAELIAWKNSAPPFPQSRLGAVSLWRLLIGATLLAGLTGAAYFGLRAKGPPAQLRIQDNTLIVSNQARREMWRKTFDKRLNGPTQPQQHEEWRREWIGDLDADGRTEVLFAPELNPLGAGDPSLPLICYSEHGREKWRFVPGRSVSTIVESFQPPYALRQFLVATLETGGPKVVLVSSYHHMYYPAQIVLLSAQGEILREYWHPGRLDQMEIADADQDGRNEIYLGGINNARRMATLVVLDPNNFSGVAVEERQDYQLQDFNPGKERARVLFPRTCFSRKERWANCVERLWVRPGQVRVTVSEALPPKSGTVLYHFTGDLKLEAVTLSDEFRSHHAELEAHGVLDHKLNPAEEAELRNIRFLTAPPEALVRAADLGPSK